MIAPLPPEERTAALAEIPGWAYDPARRALYRRLVLADFGAAMAVMLRIALAAEKADHHPEWANVYNRIDIWLTTHDAGGVSPRDLALARAINQIAPP